MVDINDTGTDKNMSLFDDKTLDTQLTMKQLIT